MRDNRIIAVEQNTLSNVPFGMSYLFAALITICVFHVHSSGMSGNPTVCYLGVDYMLHHSIYCSCAAGFAGHN